MSLRIGFDLSLTSVQAFVVFLAGQGWNVGSIPIIDEDRENEDWSVLLNP